MHPIHITNHAASGKLEGLRSINTSVLGNAYCSRMRKTMSVCARCYAAPMEKRYHSLRARLIQNHELLSAAPLKDREIPVIMERFFRLHSLGELINATHLLNFMAIADKNPGTTFSLWTKRKELVARVLATSTKPPNLILIYSITGLDVDNPRLPKHFDKTFGVFTKDSTADLNCHGKCKDCMKCYNHDTETQIQERLK